MSLVHQIKSAEAAGLSSFPEAVDLTAKAVGKSLDGMSASFGHNEITVRLGILASDAQIALERVAKGEGDTIEGWLAYGAALNEGRALFPVGDNVRFSEWIASIATDNLSVAPNDHERSAAMWAAAYPDQFAEARAAGNARTVRGIYAKWNEINAERAAAEARAAAEKARKDAQEKAAAEAEARRKEQEAKDEEARKAAEAKRVEAEKAASKAAAQAKKAETSAKKAEAKVALKEAVVEAAKQGLRGDSARGGRNPNYVDDPAYKMLLQVLGPCRALIEKVDDGEVDINTILSAFLDPDHRQRALTDISRARDFLTSVLEKANAH